MLRRKPTAITLTTEDIAIYEDKRRREALERARAAHIAHAQKLQQAQLGQLGQMNRAQNTDPNDEIRPIPGDRRTAQQHIKTREERLGIAGQSRS